MQFADGIHNAAPAAATADFLGLDVPLPNLFAASLLCPLITGCAVASGIGGGGLLVPLYSTVLGVGSQRAVPMSMATIMGAATINNLIITRHMHPEAQRPLIDYSIAIAMQPGVLCGAIAGVALHTLLPFPVVLALLVLVLGFTTHKTLKTGMKRWGAENAETLAKRVRASSLTTNAPLLSLRETAEALRRSTRRSTASSHAGLTRSFSRRDTGGTHERGSRTSLGASLLDDAAADVSCSASRASGAADDIERTTAPLSDPELAELLLSESTQFPLSTWAVFLLMTAVAVGRAVATGGVVWPSMNPCNPLEYWPPYAAPMLLYACLSAYFARRNHKRFLRKRELDFPFCEGDIAWTAAAAATLPLVAFGAGICAGILGIGGGVLLGPLFLQLKVQPQVVAATTGFMLLWTSSATAVNFLTLGALSGRILAWWATLGGFGALVGQKAIRALIVRTGRPSIVTLLLATLIGAGVLVMTITGVIEIVHRWDDPSLWRPNLGPFECNVTANVTSANALFLM